MRTFALLALSIAACGGDDSPSPDAPTGNHPDPMIIPGGGIGGGAIDGVVNFYAIDDRTREPVAGATVRIGDLEGTTDATGLFVAQGLVGPQKVTVTAASYRSEVWLGANGANMTASLELANPTVPQATLSGTVANLSSVPVPTGHARLVLVGYSHDETLDDRENNLKTPSNGNACIVVDGPCNFSVVTRAGKVSLIGLVYDYDNNGTPLNNSDDIVTLIRYAYRTGIDVTAGQDMTGQDLTLVPANMHATETVDWGTPPAGLSPAIALIGIELADGSGVLQLPVVNGTSTSASVPALANFSGSKYRLSGIAQNTAMPPTQSIVLRRSLTSATLTAGMWTEPPTGVSITRTSASWTNSPNATLHSVEYNNDTSALLNITSFDGSSSTDIPDLVTLPGGTITAKVVAITAIGIDLGDLSIDRDRDKLTGAANTPSMVP